MATVGVIARPPNYELRKAVPDQIGETRAGVIRFVARSCVIIQLLRGLDRAGGYERRVKFKSPAQARRRVTVGCDLVEPAPSELVIACFEP